VPAGPSKPAEVADLLSSLRADPGSSAIFCDIDGTLAPIAERPDVASVPDDARDVLASLARRAPDGARARPARRYAVVGCGSGRRAEEARRLVGLDELVYIGNHGFERFLPDVGEVRLDPAVVGHEDDVAAFLEHLDARELVALGIRIEDKGPICALHWRGAADERSAEAAAREIATDAIGRNLVPHWGRKVLEIRPAVNLDKGTALAELLDELRVAHALYGGDDRTDIDAFRRLRELKAAGDLDSAVCIGIISDEGPSELAEEADVLVEGPAGFLDVLRSLEES
jgi:trehalose 6-phosphate phosphatase